MMLLLKSAVSSADTNSSRNSHSISFWFYPGRGLFLGQEVLVSRNRWEQCEHWTVLLVQTGEALALGWESLSWSSEFLLPSGSLCWCLGALG